MRLGKPAPCYYGTQLQDDQQWTHSNSGRVREVITAECYLDGNPNWRKEYAPMDYMQYREILPRKGRVTTILRTSFYRWLVKGEAWLTGEPQ